MLCKSSVAALVGSLAVTFAQSLPVISPAIDFSLVEKQTLANLAITPSDKYYWGAGSIPQSCKDIATDKGLSPTDFTVFYVVYDDCDIPWTFCRHKNAPASEDNMVQLFGRMAVKTRSYVRVLIATPGLGDGAVAWTYSNGDTVLENIATTHVLAHEFSHSLDWHAVPDYPSPFSSTSTFQDLYNYDSASVSDYSRTSWMECFAEIGIIGLYSEVVPGALDNIKNWNEIENQLAGYEAYVGNDVIPGGSCTARFEDPPIVSMTSSAKLRRDAVVPNAPWPNIKDTNITIITPRPEIEGQVVYQYE